MTNKQEIPADILNEAERQVEILSRGTIQIVPEGGLKEKIIRSLQTGKPLNIKLGMDPTAPDIHLGHTVSLHKMRQFQELGHKAQLLVGDFTASIGDPSGRNKTRPPLTQEEIKYNSETYADQAFKVIDKTKNFELYYNSEWSNKLNFADVIRLLSNVTVSQIMQREDFNNRYTNNLPIAMHELLYPIMQGYDSVAMETDIELGGTDQTFNCLMGREMQKVFKQPQQVVLTMPIIEGTDGVQKMSKSLGNYIAVRDTPNDMFGKIMSITDEIMPKYFEYLTDANLGELPEHPMEAKKQLANIVVTRFHDEMAARTAREDFEARFSKNEIPEDLPEHNIDLNGEVIGLITLLVKVGFAGTNGEARRLITQNAVKLDGELHNNPKEELSSNSFVLQAGKRRMAKVSLV